MDELWVPVLLSLKTALVSTGVTVLMALPTAWVLKHRKKTVWTVVDCALVLPLILPPSVVGFILLMILGRSSIVGKVLYAVGLSPVFSWWATVIAATVVTFPLIYRTARGAFEQLDETLIKAGRTLGASEFKIIRTIVLPLAWPGLGAGIILGFSRAMGEFGATLMLAGNIPNKTQTLPLAIYFAAEGGHMDRAWLWVGIMVALSFTFLMLINFKLPWGVGIEGRQRQQ